MSEPLEDPHPPLEPDRLPVLRLALSGVAALVAIGLGITVAAVWAIDGAPESPPERAQPFDRTERISGVLQTLIVPHDATAPATPLGSAPSRFGWVDREQGLVSLPVEEAMAWVVEGAR